MGFIGMYSAIGLMILMAGKIFFMNLSNLSLDLFSNLIYVFILGITIIVLAIPEGLPLAVTLWLALSVGKMK